MTGFSSRAADPPAGNEVHALGQSNNAFGLDLYAKLKTTDGNLFFSPYSISTCLAMVYAGAQAQTAAQMAQALHFNPNQSQLASAFGELQRQLNATEQKKGVELNAANGLWGQKDHPFLPAFLDIASNSYQAKLNQVDFRASAEPVRKEINDWVSGKTKGKITNLLAPGLVSPTTRLILVNAIYFKGQWTRPFNKANTTNAPFSLTSSQSAPASFMNLKADFKYAAVNGIQLLELPYAGGDFSMVVLLPNEIDGLKTLEATINAPALDGWLAKARSQKVNVFMPKFKLAAQFSLAGTLAQMGMKDAFTPAADFSGMDGARDLFISAVVHKAFVDVNEEGTEAAAATGAGMKMLAIRPQPVPTFRADHPFIFLIRDTRSGGILFLGRLLDPTV
jgi:serpin B